MSVMNAVESIPEQLDIVYHGGGGGLPKALKGTAELLPDAQIGAVVATGDGGSATGISREVYQTVALGDAWKTVAAVGTNGIPRILKHRFAAGETADSFRRLNFRLLGVLATMKGVDVHKASDILEDMADDLKELPKGVPKHTYGCLALTALTLANGNLASEGIVELSKWAGVPKNIHIMPITNERHDVVMWDGEIIYGEGKIDNHPVQNPLEARVWLQRSRTDECAPKMYEGAVKADSSAGFIGVGPGSLWTSEIPSLAADGMAAAAAAQKRNGGSMGIIANLCSERQSTRGMALSHYVVKLQGPTGPSNDRPITGRPFDYLVHDKGTTPLPNGLLRIDHDAETLSDLGVLTLPANIMRIVAPHVDPNDPIGHMRSEATGVEHDMTGVLDALAQHQLVPARV